MSNGRPRLPREFVVAHKRRRMIDAMSEVCAEQGYEAAKISDVVRRAHVSRKTLYDNFSGKEELLLAALDTALADAEGEVAAVCGSIPADDWRSRTEAGLRAVLDFIVAHPAAAKVCLIEAPAATPASAARHEAALEGFIARLRAAAPSGPGRAGTFEEALIGGTVWIVQRRVRRDPGSVDELFPELAQFLTSPYRGVEKR